MRSLTYVVATSLDGYVASPDGDFSAFGSGNIDFHVTEIPELLPTHARAALGIDSANRHFDTMVQGRTSYEIALAAGITRPYAHLREFVCSTTLTSSPHEAVTLTADPVATVRALKAEPAGLGICLIGGPTIAATLMNEIDELFLKRYPVMFGAGKPLFDGAPFAPSNFALVERHCFDDGSDYTRFRRLD